MERDIRIDKGVLQSIVTEQQYKDIMKLQLHFDGEGDEVKVIKKAIKKLDKPNFNNIAEKLKGVIGGTKLRRLLDLYDNVEWKADYIKQEGKGRPMKIYKRIKK